MAEPVLVVRAGGRWVGLPLAQLEAVIEPGELLAVPSAEPAVTGVATLRGTTLPVVNLAALLTDGAAVTRGDVGIIISAAGIRLCLEVDEADVVLRGEPLPMPRDAAVPWAHSVIRHDGALLPLLDLGALAARLTETGRA